MRPLAITGSGVCSSVGFSAAATAAALRGGLNAFAETRFVYGEDWLVGAEVPLESGARGRERLLELAQCALADLLSGLDAELAREWPLLLVVAESTRPGRSEGLDQSMIEDLERKLGRRFHPDSLVFEEGALGAARALEHASTLLDAGAPSCLLAGVDSLLTAATLDALDRERRLMTAARSNGLVPGEAAAAVMLAPARGTPGESACVGLGFGEEPACLSASDPPPQCADGMVAALRGALADADCGFEAIDYRIADHNGEQYGFREASLAIARTLRERKPEFEVWTPLDGTGTIGAATLPLVLAVAEAAGRKGYAPGRAALCHFSADDERRAALVVRHEPQGDA